jgi:hypothetical protein
VQFANGEMANSELKCKSFDLSPRSTGHSLFAISLFAVRSTPCSRDAMAPELCVKKAKKSRPKKS